MLRLGISSFFFHTIRIKAEVPLFDLIEQPKVISEWTNDNDFDGSIILYSVEQLFLPIFLRICWCDNKDVLIKLIWPHDVPFCSTVSLFTQLKNLEKY